MAELPNAELTRGRESTHLPHTHKLRSLKIKSCPVIHLAITFVNQLSFPDPLRLIEMVPVLKKLKVLTLLNLLPLLSYVSLWQLKPFPNRSTYHVYIGIYICMLILRSIFGLLHDYLCSQSWIIIIYVCRLSALSFIQVCWCQVSWVWKSSFRFLHVHTHTDPVNYIHVLQ